MKPKAGLIILDGFGYKKETYGNAIAQASMEFYQSLWNQYPHTLLQASGLAVGLPKGQMGNSEVGHLNLGAGRVVYQTYAKIDQSIENKSFFKNPVLVKACDTAIQNNTPLHLLGLVSDGGVHSHLNHFLALVQLAKDLKVKEVFIHAFLDGRDVAPQSANQYLSQLEEGLKKIGLGQIATLSGRYYAMDRDNRWDRIQKAYHLLTKGQGERANSFQDALNQSYQKEIYDEFLLPTLINPQGLIKNNHSAIFVNFRPDRARELSRALAIKDFKEFQRDFLNLHFFCMAQYDAQFPFPVAFLPEDMKNILTDVLAQNHFSQLRLAETEKYAHVTFFFNGQKETPSFLEERVLIPSPNVATYDLKPEMSAFEITQQLEKQIKSNQFDVFIVNYANPDMVGHTGNLKATIQALQSLDKCLKRVISAFQEQNIPVMITADHGNADEMLTPNGEVITAHSVNPVPFILVHPLHLKLKDGGVLADVAPTLLDLLNIPKPLEMTGQSLILS